MHAEFIAGEDSITFLTRTNGDKITIQNINLDAENAANLAHMIQSAEELKVEISTIPP